MLETVSWADIIYKQKKQFLRVTKQVTRNPGMQMPFLCLQGRSVGFESKGLVLRDPSPARKVSKRVRLSVRGAPGCQIAHGLLNAGRHDEDAHEELEGNLGTESNTSPKT